MVVGVVVVDRCGSLVAIVPDLRLERLLNRHVVRSALFNVPMLLGASSGARSIAGAFFRSHLGATIHWRRVNLHSNFCDLRSIQLRWLHLSLLLLKFLTFDKCNVLITSDSIILSGQVPWHVCNFLHLK